MELSSSKKKKQEEEKEISFKNLLEILVNFIELYIYLLL